MNYVSQEKLIDFLVGNEHLAVSFGETQKVKDGVECDVYTFSEDPTKDLAVVRVDKSTKTPLQRVLSGNSTVEGFVSGKGTLVVTLADGTVNKFIFDESNDVSEVVVEVGQVMQWTASDDQELVFYEICDPPYEDGRYEVLPD